MWFKDSGELFDINIKVLFVLGLWDVDDGESRFKKNLYAIYKAIINSSMITFNITTIAFAYLHRNEALRAMENFNKTIAVYNASLKVIFYLHHKDEIKELIQDMRASGDVITNKTRKMMNLVTFALIVGVSVLISVFSCISVSEKEQLYELWLPFGDLEPYTTKWFLVIQIELFLISPGLWRLLIVEAFIAGLLIYMCEQLDFLSEHLRSIQTNDNVEQEMKFCVKKHIRLIRYATIMRDLFNKILLIQNLAVTIELCFAAVIVTMNGKHGQIKINFILYLVITLGNAYLYCYLGNNLIIKSEEVGLAAYESQWTNWPVKHQKDIALIIRCAQRPLFLTSGNMAILSLETYSKIIYNGYSIFAILCDAID